MLRRSENKDCTIVCKCTFLESFSRFTPIDDSEHFLLVAKLIHWYILVCDLIYLNAIFESIFMIPLFTHFILNYNSFQQRKRFYTGEGCIYFSKTSKFYDFKNI